MTKTQKQQESKMLAEPLSHMLNKMPTFTNHTASPKVKKPEITEIQTKTEKVITKIHDFTNKISAVTAAVEAQQDHLIDIGNKTIKFAQAVQPYVSAARKIGSSAAKIGTAATGGFFAAGPAGAVSAATMASLGLLSENLGYLFNQAVKSSAERQHNPMAKAAVRVPECPREEIPASASRGFKC